MPYRFGHFGKQIRTNIHCAKCGMSRDEHKWYENKSSKEHSTFKLTDKLTAQRVRQMLPFRLEFPNGECIILCRRYKGCCIEGNECFALKDSGGGESGYGGCIYSLEVRCVVWVSEGRGEGLWVVRRPILDRLISDKVSGAFRLAIRKSLKRGR